MPAGVRAALCRVPVPAGCCGWAELAASVQLAGRLSPVLPSAGAHGAGSGAPRSAGAVVLVELPTAAAAARLCRLAAGLSPGTEVLLAVPPAAPPAPGPPSPTDTAAAAGQIWRVLLRPATPLVQQAGLVDRRGQPLLGLPSRVLRGGACCAAAAWRAALLTGPAPTGPAPTLTSTSPSMLSPPSSTGLGVQCPNTVLAVALVGLARHVGVAARVQTRHGVEHTVVSDPTGIDTLLHATGGPDAVRAFTAARPPRRHRSGAQRAATATLAGQNAQRASRSAAQACAQISAAFTTLGGAAPGNPAIPTALYTAGMLRLTHPELSLAALATMADPPTSKDALAGRIRRLLALAERHPPQPDTRRRTG